MKFKQFINEVKMARVFLGGTCNNSTWRDELIPKLKITYFNPVVKEWNDAAYQRELKERETADFVLYVLTPKMTGVYSIAELIDDSNKRPKKTIFCYLKKDGDKSFDKAQLNSIESVGKMVEKNGGNWFQSMNEVITFLNKE